MIELVGAVIAGVLTILAPCVLPVLPVIVGGTLASSPGEQQQRSLRAPLIITASLGLSVVAFTLLLKATTALLGIPQEVWQWISGGILIVLGSFMLFPVLWEHISMMTGLQQRSNRRLAQARAGQGTGSLILTGAALGPVFTSCSPLYGYVIVTVLPSSFAYGMVLLVAYVIGLCAMLLLIALAGKKVLAKVRWAADPDGWFRRLLGAVFVIIGLLIITGWMKDLETWLIINSPIKPWNLDQNFIS